MTLFLNKIFYPYSPIDTIDSLQRLDAFIWKKGIPFVVNPQQKEEKKEMITSQAKQRAPLFSNDSASSEAEGSIILPKVLEENVFVAPHPIISTLSSNDSVSSEAEGSIILPNKPLSNKPLSNKPLSNKPLYPRREDSLFWCMFISHHGFPEYHHIGSKYANRELEEKQRIMDTFRKTPALLKETNYKVTNVLIQEILSDLLVNKKSSLSTLLALVVFYKKKVFLTTEHTYLYYSYDKIGDIEDTLIIHWDAETKLYGLDQDITDIKVQEIQSTKIRLEHMNKPLKGASTYKMGELLDFARILNIPAEKAKKTELYELIYQKCLRN